MEKHTRAFMRTMRNGAPGGRCVLVFPTGTRDRRLSNGDWKMEPAVGDTLRLFPEDTYYVLCNFAGDGDINPRGSSIPRRGKLSFSLSSPWQREKKKGSENADMRRLMSEMQELPRDPNAGALKLDSSESDK